MSLSIPHAGWLITVTDDETPYDDFDGNGTRDPLRGLPRLLFFTGDDDPPFLIVGDDFDPAELGPDPDPRVRSVERVWYVTPADAAWGAGFSGIYFGGGPEEDECCVWRDPWLAVADLRGAVPALGALEQTARGGPSTLADLARGAVEERGDDLDALVRALEGASDPRAALLAPLRPPPRRGPRVRSPADRELAWSASRVSKVSALAFLPDSRVLLAAAGDMRLRCWDLPAVTRPAFALHLPDEYDRVRAVAVSRDRAKVAGITNSHRFCLWDVATRERDVVQQLPFLPRVDRHVALDSTGRTAAFVQQTRASDDVRGRMRVWDLTANPPEERLLGDDGVVLTLAAFGPDDSVLALGGEAGVVALWDTATWTMTRRLRGLSGNVEALAFSPDGHFLAAGVFQGGIRVWEVSTGRQVARMDAKMRPAALAFSAGGTELLSVAGTDVLAWTIATGRVRAVRRIDIQFQRIFCAAFSPDASRFAVGQDDGQIRVWELTGSEQE